jgi:RNA polymerase sigma factor (sigma-70 family)
VTDPERQDEQQETLRLVRASRAGDEDAFRRLVELKRDKVFRVAYHHLGKPEDARQVAQAVFVRLWRHLGRYDETRPFDTWLYQVTANAAIDHHRRAKVRSPERPLDEARLSAAPAGDSVQADEIRRILAELVSLLSEKQRLAFVLREVEGLPTSEVAAALGATESTVRNHVFQARKILRDELTSRYPEYAGRLGEAVLRERT